MALVAQNIHIPIATGERLHTIYEFEALLSRGAVQYVRPDVCLAGGLTALQKDRRPGRGAPRRRRAPQPAQPGQHRGLPATGRLHPQLRPAGIPQGRAGAAQERDRQDPAARRGRLS